MGILVFTVVAVDADTGTNSEISYSLGGSASDQFIIDPASGKIRVSELGVDYERQLDTPIVLVVTARDHGNSTVQLATTTLNVTVTDTNDNRPVFINAPYSQTVAENITGPAVILAVTAFDEDVSSNGEIVYSLSGETERFEINEQSVSKRTLAARLLLDLIHSASVKLLHSFSLPQPFTNQCHVIYASQVCFFNLF